MAESAGLTPSQTVGPFLHIALDDAAMAWAVPEGTAGAFTVGGVVLDGAGEPIVDALVETWQADGHFGRSPTDDSGEWRVHTVKPPSVTTHDGTPQAPHLVVSVFARGLLDRVVTRLYFSDEEDANRGDPTLAVVPIERRHLLLADGSPADGYRLDIRLQGSEQGDDESVFFAV